MEVTNFWNGKEYVVFNDATSELKNYKDLIAKEDLQTTFLNSLILNSTDDPT